jgi:hypothetical protein
LLERHSDCFNLALRALQRHFEHQLFYEPKVLKPAGVF